MKMTFAIAAAVATLGFTSNAMASVTFTTSSAGAYYLDTVGLSGTINGLGPYNQSAYAGPIVLQGTYDGTPFDVVSFCFDLFHDINVGFGYQAGATYTYTTAPIAFDNSTGIGTGNPLTLAQASDMSGLSQLGAKLFLAGSTDLADEMPAIQAAIWHDEYGLSASFNDAAELSYYNSYIGLTFAGPPGVAILAESADGQVVGTWQGLLPGGGLPVPEPATWAMMIVGLFSMGAALRNTSRKLRTA
jgi:hypothetical protein